MDRTLTNGVSMTVPSEGRSSVPAVVVLILMYGKADEAIACVSSVLESRDVASKIILLDNRSPDGALDQVRAWARGELAPTGMNAKMPGIAEVRCGPIDHIEIDAEATTVDISRLPTLTLVDTKANRGYAGGNNVALRWLQRSGDWEYGWILNPDTVVDPQAMAALVTRARAMPGLGAIGARICFYDAPNRIQQWGGGQFSSLRAAGRNLGLGRRATDRPSEEDVERRMSYVSGASFFFSRAFFAQAGLMDERYFLYFEEIDWCRRRGELGLGYAHDAIVYHRCGGSTGSSLLRRRSSPFSLYWQFRNRFVVTRKFDPWALPAVYLLCYYDVLRLCLVGAWARALTVLRAMHGWTPTGGRVPGNV